MGTLHRRFVVAFWAGLLCAAVPPAHSQAKLNPHVIASTIDRIAERIVSETDGYDALDSALESAAAKLDVLNSGERAESEALRRYFRARIRYLRGMNARFHDRDEQAQRLFRQALQLSRAAAASEQLPDLYRSDSFRLVADCHAQLMQYTGAIYMVFNGSEARQAAFSAVEIEPRNPRAHVTLASYFANAPAAAGGDPAEALRHSRKALSLLTPEERAVRFMALGWKALAYYESGERAASHAALRAAQSLFPHNRWIDEIAAEVGAR